VGRHYDELADWMSTVAWYKDDYVESTVLGLIPSTATQILELGCGSGHLLRLIAERMPWARLTGVEVSEKMARNSRERVKGLERVQVVEGDWTGPLQVRGDSGRYDVIIVKNVLHLLPNLPVRLRTLREFASAGAKLIIVETISPNRKANSFIRTLFSTLDLDGLKRHFFTRQSLNKALIMGGWDQSITSSIVRQHIDVADWLDHKSGNDAIRREADLIIRSCDREVKTAMEFEPRTALVPASMLRLQLVTQSSLRHFSSFRHSRRGPRTPDRSQLELL
jgi:SAM-dependent methyltransferase